MAIPSGNSLKLLRLTCGAVVGRPGGFHHALSARRTAHLNTLEGVEIWHLGRGSGACIAVFCRLRAPAGQVTVLSARHHVLQGL